MTRLGSLAWLVGVGLALGCSAADEPSPGEGGGGSGTGAGTGTGGHGVGGFGVGGLGTGGNGTGNAAPSCKVIEGGDAVPECQEKAPADAFSPTVQWTWTAPPSTDGFADGSTMTPLVGNFNDDNGDGAIDLCDMPDVIVSALSSFGGTAATGRMFMLRGDTGVQELEFQGQVQGFAYPAFGDIDGDGLPEVVTSDPTGHVIAFKNDGSLKWTGDVGTWATQFSLGQCPVFALYDLDGDGHVEILAGFEVFDYQGHKLWGVPGTASEFEGQYWCSTPTAADLDGDGELEVLFGHQTYHADGTLAWSLPGLPAHPHVANLDDDPEPEIFLTRPDGILVLEHDGTVKFGPVRPTDPNMGAQIWGKPAVVHDFDGDSKADLAAATSTDYSVYTVGPSNVTPKWSAAVQDISGNATATAFDFLGDGVADGIYADETLIHVYDGKTGAEELTSPRTSGTVIEYPVVADIDNDGSAEILYVSNYFGGTTGPTLTAIGDAQNRWIRARRIWNQYSYHVTNVREDGTIPKVMKKNWELLNTFRTNSQVGDAGDCDPAEPPK